MSDQLNLEPTSDEWVCRIPRAHLRALAGSMTLKRRERVLLALLSELYERTTETGGEAAVSLSELERLTGLQRRAVRTMLAELAETGALAEVPVSPGRTKKYRLQGCTDVVHTKGAQASCIAGEGSDDRICAPPSTESVHPPMHERRAQTYAQTSCIHEKKEETRNSLRNPGGAETNGSKDPDGDGPWPDPDVELIKYVEMTLGRMLSAADVQDIHAWRVSYPTLSELEMRGEVGDTCERFAARGKPIQSMKVFEGRLQARQAAKVDAGEVRPRTNGQTLTAIGDLLAKVNARA